MKKRFSKKLLSAIKNIVFLFIVLTFAFNSFGFIFYYLIEKEEVKEEAFKEIAGLESQKRIETICLSLSDTNGTSFFQRINNREIRYEGKMYDVVREVKDGSKIIFYCVHDVKEDKLEKEFSSNLGKSSDTKNTTNAQMQFNHQIQFVELIKNLEIESPTRKNIYQAFHKRSYALKDFKTITPPPKSILF